MDKSLLNVRPELCEEWSEKNYPLTPDDISYGSNRKVIWHGRCGHEWLASVKSRTTNNTGCPFCSHNRILIGFNDLASQYPEIAEEWSDKNLPLTPQQVTPFSNKKVWWNGKCGHEWYALISSRSDGHGCPYCNDKKLLPGDNDFQTLHPDLAAEWSERNTLKPNEIPEKKTGLFWWRCSKCGGEYQAWITSRLQGSKCPYCSDMAVLPGFNDLASRYPQIAAEWNYEKNKGIQPEQILSQSKAVYWWKGACSHEWKARVYDRTVLKQGCSVCESEFLTALPQLLLMLYCGRKGLRVHMNTDGIIGIPLDMYVPDLKAAFEFEMRMDHLSKVQEVKQHLCTSMEIQYFVIRSRDSPEETVAEIRKALSAIHFYPTGKTDEDITIARKRYELLKNNNTASAD